MFQAGSDFTLHSGEDETLVAGLTAHYASSALDADDDLLGALGHLDSDAFGLGANISWYSNSGFYADLTGQANWYELDLDNTIAGTTGTTEGYGYGIGLEIGYEVPISKRVLLVPQAQLTWQQVDFDPFIDSGNTKVAFQKGENLEGRLGAAVHWKMADPGGEYLVTGQVNASLLHEFSGESSVTVAGTPVSYALDGTGAEIGVGFDIASRNGISAFGEVGYRTSFDSVGTNEIAATLGMRVSF